MALNLTPLGDRVIIEPADDEASTSSGGIIIPDSAKEKPQEGKIVAVGNGKVAEDGTVSPLDVKKGDKILMNFPGANHDPDHFEDAHEVQLDRQRNRHIAFGVGIHRCAGSNLARMEMEVALKTWFERIPEFTLSDPDAVTWAGGQVRGPRIVPVNFG